MKTHFLALIYILSVSLVFGQSIVINEFMSSNSSALQDWEGDYPDWIELFNLANEEINLEGYSLSDDENNIRKYVFSGIIIPPQSFLVVFASDKDTIVCGEIHCNFKISKDGEYLLLSNPDNEIIHKTDPVNIDVDYSYSCIPDGNLTYMVESYPSPGFSNIEKYEVNCSLCSGYYESEIDVGLNSPNSGIEIRYTLDGSIPDSISQLYESSIKFNKSNYFVNIISNIPTTPLEGPWPLPEFIWKEPEEIENAHILRYAAFKNDKQVSDIYTQTYFIFDELSDRYRFPVFSLVTDSLNLFQYDTGIYIPGVKFDEFGWQWYPYGNYRERGINWERDVHISFFEEDGVKAFETDAGIRVRGSGSACNPQKSMGIYFRNEYGLNKIKHKIFRDSPVEDFKRLILRSSGNDMLQTHFRDAVLTSLLKSLDIELQNFRPSILFINGEYWGIHNIREKFDEYYFKYHFGIPEDHISILGIALEPEEGESLNYPEIHNYVTTHDMSTTESYNYIAERVDIPNMIDFLIAEIYYANYDWPCNNYRKWRTIDEDSKWRFLIHDLDLSFGFHGGSQWDKASLDHAFEDGDDWPTCGVSNQLFRAMMENQRFVNEFLDRFSWHLNNTFKTSVVLEKIDEFQELFEPEIDKHIKRWGYPASYEKWIDEIDVMKNFAMKRPCFMKHHIMDYFQLESFDFECDNFNDSIDKIFYEDDFMINPNPIPNGEFTIKSSKSILSEFEYTLISGEGKIIQTGNISGIVTKVTTSNISNGFYILKIYNSSYEFQYKLIKID